MQYPSKVFTVTLVILIHIHCLTIPVSSLDTLKQGDQLSTQLVSANGIFTLGFYTYEATNDTYLALSYTTGRSTRPVWIGNRERPIPGNTSRYLTLGAGGKLTIVHGGGGGGEPIELYGGGSVRNATATLLDSGNFVVKSNEASSWLWQSFDHPTDTLLPGMKLGVNPRRNWTLSSWLDDDNPAPGAFTLEWDPSIRNLLVRRRGEAYWRSGELKYYADEVGESIVELENFNFMLIPWKFNLTRVTSEEEDFLVLSVLPKADGERVDSGWRLRHDGEIFDTDTLGGIAITSHCYNYYHQKSAEYRGCVAREQPKCRNERQQFRLKSGDFMPNRGQVESIFDDNSSLSLSDCQEVCWNDCTCVAYASGTTGCLYWRGQNLEFEQSVDGSSVQKYFLEPAPSTKGLKKHVMIILIVVCSLVLLLFGITLFVVVRKLRKGNREKELRELLTLEGHTDNYELQNGGSKNQYLKPFSYASIQSATRNFSNKLGQGGFGPVYKGKTADGKHIAVKLLSQQSGQGLLEFKNELILISNLQHVNLVKLIGFCIHGDDKMIIYEYMHNKSLDFFLFDSSKREQLDWQKRFNIIDGTAQGLLYLHKYSRVSIIHRDLKPNNILLDVNMNPKISDFGLARIFKQNASEEANTSRGGGTFGYMAPEYAFQKKFSVKSDVYSFGVLVLEIVSGRKNNSFHQIEGPLNLVEYTWELMDPMLRESCDVDQLQRCVHIGLLCVEYHAADRPTIEYVILMLKNVTTTLPMPKSPVFFTRDRVVEEVGKRAPEKLSANEVTLSEVQGR